MQILGIQQTLQGVYEITCSAGSAFFLREEYLSLLSPRLLDELACLTGQFRLDGKAVDVSSAPESVRGFLEEPDMDSGEQEGECKGIFLNEEASRDLLKASKCFECEKDAMNYLSRAEQNRFNLAQKLIKKGWQKEEVSNALDYLESVSYLDDLRFANAWLRSRAIDHSEGRTRQQAELMSRGISKDVAKQALDEFYKSHTEEEACEKAYAKLLKTKKDSAKLQAALVRLGFSYALIKQVMSQESES